MPRESAAHCAGATPPASWASMSTWLATTVQWLYSPLLVSSRALSRFLSAALWRR